MENIKIKTTQRTNVYLLRYKMKLLIIGIFLLLSIVYSPEQTYAKSKQIDLEYADACEEAIKTIQPLNVDKLENR